MKMRLLMYPLIIIGVLVFASMSVYALGAVAGFALAGLLTKATKTELDDLLGGALMLTGVSAVVMMGGAFVILMPLSILIANM